MRYLESPAKAALTAAFKDLRKLGWVARQSFWCCDTCAGYDLGQNPKNDGKPAVFYNKQEAASFQRSGEVYLAWGRVNGTLFKSDAEQLVRVLEAHGLEVEWNGKDSGKVLVKGMAQPVVEPEATYLDLVGAV
jgi:hypothetical protein